MRTTWRYVVLSMAVLCLAVPVALVAQSQAANGVIEGRVTDPSGAVVPGAGITLLNVGTGVEREAVSNDDGFYRAPLLPLGQYTVTVSHPGFNKFVQSGIQLSAGQTATVHIALQVGNVENVVSVVADAPIADSSKIEVGRTVSEAEVKNLPLPSRNPYNFGLLQPGVNGFENVEFGVPRFNANGFKSRINYQLDGNTNTQKDRAGLRLSPISEIFVREVQVVSNGFSPEFGQTSGVVYNAVTPSGSNDFHGEAAYFLRRTPFVARPFFLRAGVPKADPGLDNVIGALGGPLKKDQAHFYVGYEFVDRELQQDRVVTVTAANAAALGLPAQPGFIPASQRTNFFIFKPNWKLNSSHELVGRYTLFTNNSPNNIGGGLNTLERSIDFKDNIQTANAQLISILSPRLLNEFRFQFSRRNQPNATNSLSGSGPSITVSGVANFGAPTNGGTLFNERIWQVLNNVTWMRGNHSIKFGADLQVVRDSRLVTLASTYNFPNTAAFLAAKNGTNPRSYSTFSQVLGDPGIEFGSQFFFLFLQDDWRVRPNLKLTYGLRYELYDIPDARSNSPLPVSQKFNRDTNNFAPRLGLAYSFGQARKTVLRASAGIFYDAPGLAFYQNAIQNNGDPLFRTFSLRPTDTGSPAFPGNVSTSGLALPRVSIDALDPNFANMYSFNQNLQIEQELNRDISVTVGYIHAAGTRLPVVRRTNLPAVASTLGDGRAVFGTGARPNAAFNNIDITESFGKSSYHAGTLSLNRRFAQGYQFSASYTWSHAIDDAPEVNIIDSTEFMADPTNRRRDRGNALADQRHTFIFSGVFRPRLDLSNRAASAILNDNQFGVIARFNSGFRVNPRANSDLNRDGISTNDRPLHLGRNIATTGTVSQIDLRYSRFFPIREQQRVEVIGEFTNLFNMVNVSSVNPVVTVDAAGNPNLTQNNVLTARSTKSVATGGFPQRIFQLGFKYHF